MIRAIKPLANLDGAITIPGSKSYTQRALVIAALAEGSSVLHRPLLSEDTRHLINALRSLGVLIVIGENDITVTGTGGRLLTPSQPLRLGNNGTALRLLTTLVTLGRGLYTLTGDTRLCERPIKPLIEALRTLGVNAHTRDDAGFPPVVIHADGLRGGHVVLQDIESSQYVSSLLISAPYARDGLEINLSGRTPSMPYVQMTLEAMQAFGHTIETPGPHGYRVKGGPIYQGRSYDIEGDISSASYFFLAAALLKGRIRVNNVNPHTLQGDLGLVALMEALGVSVDFGDHWIEITGDELKKGDDHFDLGGMPDMVPTFAVLAAMRPGRTIIENVAHLRYKESNRLAAMTAELRRVGIRAEETKDGLFIEGGVPHGADIETYNDHRIAMSFAILGLAIPGMRIKNSACVNKSFPGFWQMLDNLYES